MRWEIERYVKLYRRDTPEWSLVPWRAKGLFDEMLRKCDLDGRIECGRLSPAQAVAVLIGAPSGDVPEVEKLLEVLLADGCVRDVAPAGRRGRHLFMPNYREAQTVPLTGAERTAKWREEQREALQARSRDGSDGRRHARHARHAPVDDDAAEQRNTRSATSVNPRAKAPQADECDDVTARAEPSRAEPSSRSRSSPRIPGGAPANGAAAAPDPLGLFRRALAGELAIASANPLRLAKPALADELREHVARLGGPAAAAEVVAEACRERGRTPSTLDYVATFIAELEPPVPHRAVGESPKPGDPDFNDPAAWLDHGAYLARTDGKSWEQATGLKRPVHRPTLTPEEEAELAKAGGRS